MIDKIVRSKIDDYQYDKILREKIPKIAEIDPIKVTQLLTSKLRKSVFLYRKSHGVEKGDDDGSYQWRPAIEEHTNNWDLPDTKSDLVKALRNTLEIASKKNIDILKKSLEIIAKENYIIFRRLELYMYSLLPKDFVKEIEVIVISYFSKWQLIHEYHLMLNSAFSILNGDIQKEILSLIDKGPDFAQFHGTKEEFEFYKKRWRVDKLEPIINYLDDEKKKEYSKLLTEVGSSDLSNFVVTHSTLQKVESHSDLSQSMTPDQVLAHLQKYKVDENNFLEGDGNTEKFRELVKENSYEYSIRSLKLLDLHPLFSSRFFWGLVDATKEKRKVDWNNVLTLCENIFDAKYQKKYNVVLDSIIGHVSNLFESSLHHAENSIMFEERERVWKIIEKLVENSGDDTAWSQGYPRNGFDAYGISINSSRGQAMHAVMQYAVWCYFGLKKEGKDYKNLVPEVKKLLEKRLDPKIDNTISTYSVFGAHLNNLFLLDKEWTRKNVSNIFKTEQYPTLSNAAWDSYLIQQIYSNIFIELKTEYEKRIMKLQTTPLAPSGADTRVRVVEHVGLTYLLQIQGSDDLFELLLQNAPKDLIEHLLEFMGRTLRDYKKDNKSITCDIRKLWERKELMKYPQIGWFFVSGNLDNKVRLEMLDKSLNENNGKIEPMYFIPEELESLSKEYPMETIVCLEKIVRAYQKSWELYHMQDHVINIITIIHAGNNSSAIEKANEVADLFWKWGFEKFKGLYKDNTVN